MLIIQQNYRKKDKYTISILEASIGIDAGIVYIQKLFLRWKNFAYSRCNLYWLIKTYDYKDH